MTPIPSASNKQGCTSRTHFLSLQTRTSPSRAGRCLQLHCVQAALQLDGSLTVIGRASLPKDRVGEGKKSQFCFPGRKDCC